MAHKANAKNGETVRKATSVQIKQEITEMHERAVNIIALISECGLPQSTISTIMHVVCFIYALSMFILILMI
jgi:hypothetical protein